MPKLMSLIHHLVWLAKGIKIFALVGKSGTGKSFRAQLVAQKYGIELIIDDGLLIRDQKILAGETAKKEKGILAAISTALFTHPEHAARVQRVLKNEHFKRVLIIGTSEKMVRKIASKLGLPQPSKVIQIADVASRQEIETATRARNSEGKHIIPVPAIEIKRNYPEIFIDSIKIFFKRRFHPVKKGSVIEKTVVRPVYSERGGVSISKEALTQMVLHCVQEFDPSLGIDKIVVSRDSSEYRLEVILNVPFGKQTAGNLYQLQAYILNSIEQFTGLFLKEVNLTIGKITKPHG